ncbi:MAG: folate-binding protein [Rhizobiales bacterium TMED83]|jgi:folate-binding protein YgfZ|nr:hypothetical protein [Rhodobiaceae bacterium]RPF94459.1 MAG: folate-binding protein [Rhizobiales bacterium TMED83]
MAIWQTQLPNRAVLKVTGAERVDFLQNLVTQDVTRDGPQAAALLTPQGKLAYDFIVQPMEAGFLIDCAADIAAAFCKKLTMYKLRRDVDISLTDLPVHVIWNDTTETQLPDIDGFFCDPRLARLGLRCLGAPRADLSEFAVSDAHAWHLLRISLGVPEGPTEMPPGTIFPMEFGFAHMHAIDFQKGCFVGQEVTSRVHRKGSLRKTLHPAVFDTTVPPPGTPIESAAGKVGEIIFGLNGQALVLVRVDAMSDPLQAHGRAFELRPGLFDAPQ